MDNKITEDWALYEAGKTYNNSLILQNNIDYYSMIDLVNEFYNGNQWIGTTAEKLPKPVFNYIKRGLNFFVASLSSTNVSINFEPIEGKQFDGIDIVNNEIKDILEKWKIENRLRDILFDAGITGDACVHFYYDNKEKTPFATGKICAEIVDGSNVMFGNANNNEVEKQPYIIIVGRDLAKNLQEEAKRYGNKEQIDQDTENSFMPGYNAKIEVETDKYGKALYILIYRKDPKTGTIKVSKSTQHNYIYQDVDTGLTKYPIAFMNWDRQKNSYHGKGIVVEMLPNQMLINKMYSMIAYHLMLTAFPTAVYNADKIAYWTNEIGASIPFKDMEQGESIFNNIGYIQPSNMSAYIITAIDNIIAYTKECIGISDASLGSITPNNATAIIAVQKSAVVPLENVKSNLYEMIEDMGEIILEMIATYYGIRTVVVDGQVQDFDFSTLKDAWLNIKADVGASAYYSELAQMQTLDNLLTSEKINFIQYLERIPANMIADKDNLIEEVKQAMGVQVDTQQMEILAQYMDTLPEEVQNELKKLPDAELEATLQEMMTKDTNLAPQGEQIAQNNLNQAVGQIV